jgi:hypothetical protein
MPPEAFRIVLATRPFVPFRIHVLDGRTYDIRHPEEIMISSLFATVGVRSRPPAGPNAGGNGDTSRFYDQIELVALRAISRLEPLGQPAA